MNKGMRTETGADVSRTLDEGIVISGEVEVKLLGLKVLPIKVNLLIGSTGLAESLGLSWWASKQHPNEEKTTGPDRQTSSGRTNGTGRRGRGKRSS